MADRLMRVADGFWSLRGSFRIGGIVDIGTQASLVRRTDGSFVWLDAYAYDEGVAGQIAELTDDGRKIEAIINVHPFHTVHVKRMHQRFPDAALHGTRRHVTVAPQLPWAPERTEDTALHELFRDDFAFSVPRGVDFVSANDRVHFSSVLAFHHASATIHVDDTLNYLRLPSVIRALGWKDSLSFHPTLGQALERRAGAAADFREWAEHLANDWGEARNLCSAHNHLLTAEYNRGPSIRDRILAALDGVSSTLQSHERKHGIRAT